MVRQDNSKFYILGAIIAAIILLIFLNSLGWLNWPKKVFLSVAYPVARPFNLLGIRVSDSARALFGIKGLIDENSQLQEQNQELTLKLSGLLETVEENKLLREQLRVSLPDSSIMIQANIVGFDPGNLGQYFLIDRGKKDGIKIGQAVIYAGGFLVGKINESDDLSAKVLSLTDSDSSVFCLTQEGRVSGVIRGDHGAGIFFDMVAPEKAVSQGETIISSGLDNGIPKGLLVGRVGEKISKESDVFQKFKVTPFVNDKEIESIFVIFGKSNN